MTTRFNDFLEFWFLCLEVNLTKKGFLAATIVGIWVFATETLRLGVWAVLYWKNIGFLLFFWQIFFSCNCSSCFSTHWWFFGDFLVILSLILGPGICVNMPKCCKQAAHFLLYYIIWCLDYIMFTWPNPWHRIFFYAHKSMEMVIRARKKNKTFYRKKNMIFIFLKKCLHTFVHTH